MPRFSDPVGHVRPYTWLSIPFPDMLAYPRILGFCVVLVVVSLFGTHLLLHLSAQDVFWKMSVGVTSVTVLVLAMVVCATMIVNRSTDEFRTGLRLAHTEIGKALLREGTDLHHSRCWLEAEEHLTRSLLTAYRIPSAVGEPIGPDIKPRLWEIQLALETNLLDRQRRHLAGETVAYIGHLSSS